MENNLINLTRDEITMAEILNRNRLLHMYAVAEYMYNHADDYDLKNKDELYVLGLLHDVGAIVDRNTHEHVGAKLLKNMGLSDKFTDIIYWHGSSPDNYCEAHNCTKKDIPKELLLLWEADLHIDTKGEFVSFNDRVSDIIARHQKLAEDMDLHVPLTINENGLVTSINYHRSYGNVAVEVKNLLLSLGRN